MVVCVGCSVEGEKEGWEVWLGLFKCSFDGIRVKTLMLGVLVKVGVLAWEEYLETAPQAHGGMGGKPFEGK